MKTRRKPRALILAGTVFPPIVATAYTTCRSDDGGCSIVSVRFTRNEVDGMAKMDKPFTRRNL